MAGHDDGDPALRAAFCERAVDGALALAGPGDVDVVGDGEPVGTDPSPEEGMTVAGDADHRDPGELPGPDLRAPVFQDARSEVCAEPHELFFDPTQRLLWCTTTYPSG